MGNNSPLKRAGFLVALCCIALSCGFFDSGTIWRHGNYALIWIDLPDDVSLSYDRGGGTWSGVVDPRVFSVGADERYIVVKQHPKGDKTITNYFVVNTQLDPPSKPAVTGPLTKDQFTELSSELGLPEFSKTLESLQ
jgi:hypothetical protein